MINPACAPSVRSLKDLRKSFRILKEIHNLLRYRSENVKLKLWYTLAVDYEAEKDLFYLTVNSEENFHGLMYTFKPSQLMQLKQEFIKFVNFQNDKWRIHQYKSKKK